MPITANLPGGALQIEGPDGVLSQWTVIRENGFTWLVKAGVRLNCQNRSYIQVMRVIGGKLSLRAAILKVSAFPKITIRLGLL
jgi:hypothetical protein